MMLKKPAVRFDDYNIDELEEIWQNVKKKTS